MTLTILIDAVRRFRHQNLIHSWQDSAIDEVETQPLGRSFPMSLLQTIWLSTVAGLALVLLSGCTAQARMQLEQTILARKTDSLQGWENVTLDGKPILKTLGLRTAIVFRNFETVAVRIDDSGISGEGTTGANASTGSAAPISTDGYFLTAAHCVEEADTLHVSAVVVQEDGYRRVETAPARVVWKSEDDSSALWNKKDPRIPLDFAIVHADISPLVPFELAGELPRLNEPVISAGWAFGHFDSFPHGAILAAGKVLSFKSREAFGSSPARSDIFHDIPFVSGESGAPVLDREGNLMGIHNSLGISMSILRGVAMSLGHGPSDSEDFEYVAATQMVDVNWLKDVIARDRRSNIE